MQHSSCSDRRATNRTLDHDRKSKTDTREGRLSRGVGSSNRLSQREHHDHTKRMGRELARRANQSSTKRRPHQIRESSSSSSSDSSSSSSSSSDRDLLQKSKMSTSRVKTHAPKSQKAPNEKTMKSKKSPDSLQPRERIRSIHNLDQGHKRLERRESGLSKSECVVNPTYKDAKDLSQSIRSRDSTKDETQKRQSSKVSRHTLNRQSTGSSGQSKSKMKFKTVDFNPPQAPRSDTGSEIESIEAAHKRYSSKESLDELVFDKVDSTRHDILESESLAGSNFSNTLDRDASEERAYKKREHHDTRKGDRDRVSKSLRHTDESSHLADRKYSKSAHFEFDPNNSLTSLNRSEPSLMETSTDISPKIVLGAKAKLDEHRKTKLMKADSTPKGKSKSFYEHGQTKSKAAPNGKSRSFSKSAIETTQTRIDRAERSFLTEEESITDAMKRDNDIKNMSRQGQLILSYLFHTNSNRTHTCSILFVQKWRLSWP